MTVRMLSPETIGKIAAGEVVERPVSVVKELIENAIDAGATEIAVEVEEGGSRLIRVSDNGSGMSAESLSLAVQRHATSKLTSFDDLDTLHTLGFRGEALPSIGAVARLEISTAEPAANAGSRILLDFGTVHPVYPIAARGGTTVVVEDLFANVPARRKFLRQPGTESTYISRMIGAYACERSDIRWSLVSEGRRVLTTDGQGDDISAAIGVFGTELAGEALRLEPLDSEAAVDGVEVSGWVSSPRVTRSHRQSMFFFVNGRMVQHRALQYALEEAYHSLIMVGRHPLTMVRIALDPSEVDVNVHPTKAEVKFVDERRVARAVSRATHQALLQQTQDILPEVRFSEGPGFQRPTPMNQVAFPDIQTTPRTRDPFPLPETHRSQLPPEDASTLTPAVAHPSGVPMMRVLGQVGGTYIIAEGPDGMFMIDQHAAHERIMYEKIQDQMAAKSVDRQPMLDPLVVELAPHELTAFERSSEELNAIGFEVERFGEQSVVIRAIPALVQRVDIAERIHDILGELAEGGAGTSWLESVAISAACHTSIRAGQALSLPEMRELVSQLERTRQPRACGHGRPTMLHMSQMELERQFSRR
ncbi:MAG: DNA mismatch repair endonuclease MutL [Thermomicrobiales bacterium]